MKEAKYIITDPNVIDAWGFEGDGPYIVTLEEIRRLAKEWDIPVEELLAEAEEVEA